jgi:dCMP deaminase
MNWNEYFIQKAELTAKKSKDPSTQTGVVIVGPGHVELSTGYNGFPRGVLDDDRYEDRPVKYTLISHAERNAIYNAARVGISLMDSAMYTSFGPVTCHECAKAIIQAGIKVFIGRVMEGEFGGGRWAESIQAGTAMLREAGVTMYAWNGETLEIPKRF